MPTLLEREIDRALEGKLAPGKPAATKAPSPMRKAPVVRFSPMFEEPGDAAKRRRRNLIVLSIAAHVVLLVVVLVMPQQAPAIEEPVMPISITFTAPMPEVAPT